MTAESTRAQSASRRFEDEAARWEETGQLQGCGRNQYSFLKLSSWLISPGAKVDGVSERLQRYYEAAEESFKSWGPRWYDEFLATRDWCSECGESYRLENLSLCTHCQALLGYCHQLSGGKAANGNPRCPRCEQGEIVG
jgi:hypothetical protein